MEFKSNFNNSLDKIYKEIQTQVLIFKKEKQSLLQNFNTQYNFQEDVKQLSEFLLIQDNQIELSQDGQFIDEIFKQFELIFQNEAHNKTVQTFKDVVQNINNLNKDNQIEIISLQTKNNEKTLSLNNLCAKHKKEIIMIDIDSENKKVEQRFACVQCISDNPQCQYKTIEEINQKWNEKMKQQDHIINDLKSKRLKKKEKLNQKIAEMRKNYILQLDDINEYIENKSQMNLLVLQHKFTVRQIYLIKLLKNFKITKLKLTILMIKSNYFKIINILQTYQYNFMIIRINLKKILRISRNFVKQTNWRKTLRLQKKIIRNWNLKKLLQRMNTKLSVRLKIIQLRSQQIQNQNNNTQKKNRDYQMKDQRRSKIIMTNFYNNQENNKQTIKIKLYHQINRSKIRIIQQQKYNQGQINQAQIQNQIYFTLIKIIQQKVNKQIKNSILIYSGTKDGLNNQQYWSKVNGKGNLLMVFKSKSDHILGAYSPCIWESCCGKYVADNTLSSFIFSQTNDQVFPLMKDTKKYAIYCHQNYGPVFGNGYDMKIGGDFTDGYFNLGSSYQYSLQNHEEIKPYLFGQKKPEIKECQIYELQFF
ncbi:unnamed protein product [Paramecium primaurelia]|uniref:TLDc domain-containing protein n=1 Tax=Paramecium primaurelia TaxID=5886 RepID=A0A8S1P062_PARPR|nr:unnamed protein product [Paramecium primaurelia]